MYSYIHFLSHGRRGSNSKEFFLLLCPWLIVKQLRLIDVLYILPKKSLICPCVSFLTPKGSHQHLQHFNSFIFFFN